MKVKILEVSTDELIDALIREGRSGELPSMQENWRFNFGKQLQKLKHATAFVLVTEETPNVIEGCMIFQMIDGIMPQMAFLEVAPQITGIAGNMIALPAVSSLSPSNKHSQRQMKGTKAYCFCMYRNRMMKQPEN